MYNRVHTLKLWWHVCDEVQMQKFIVHQVFGDCIVAQAKELEVRRLKRAAIQAKLIAEQAEKEASQKQNGDALPNGAGADASGEGNTDASSKGVGNSPVTDATQPHRVDMPQKRDTARPSDGEDPVMIDSDAEGQQAEDLFRETAQQNVVRSYPRPHAAGGCRNHRVQ